MPVSDSIELLGQCGGSSDFEQAASLCGVRRGTIDMVVTPHSQRLDSAAHKLPALRMQSTNSMALIIRRIDSAIAGHIASDWPDRGMLLPGR